MKPITKLPALLRHIRGAIKEHCAVEGNSYAILARDLGLSKTHVYRIATDKDRYVDQETAFKIARHLGIAYRITFEYTPD